MKMLHSLPDGYKEIFKVDLMKNKAQAIFVNVAALIISVLMIVPMHFYIPITSFFDMTKGFGVYCLRLILLLVLTLVYIMLHEAVHGIAMKCFGTKKVKYGYKVLYAYAGSDDYYGKIPYIIIALAPVIVWGLVILIINCLVPYEWFWLIYFIQIVNVSGAVGDLYVTFKFLGFPKDILVLDTGVSMTVYSK